MSIMREAAILPGMSPKKKVLYNRKKLSDEQRDMLISDSNNSFEKGKKQCMSRLTGEKSGVEYMHHLSSIPLFSLLPQPTV
jgi:hypothetical protein